MPCSVMTPGGGRLRAATVERFCLPTVLLREPVERRARELLAECVEDRLPHAVHPGGEELDDDGRPELVHDEAAEAVRLEWISR